MFLKSISSGLTLNYHNLWLGICRGYLFMDKSPNEEFQPEI